MSSKKTSFLMAVIAASIGLIWAQIAAPTGLKPLTNHLLDYPNTLPAISFKHGIYHSTLANHPKNSGIVGAINQKMLALRPQLPTIAMVINDDGGGGASAPERRTRERVSKEERDERRANANLPTSTSPTAPAPTTPSATDVIDEARQDAYTASYGDEAARYNYNYATGKAATTSEWNDPNAKIAGTYVAPNGERYSVSTPDTLAAEQEFTNEIASTITTLTNEQLQDYAQTQLGSQACVVSDLTCQQTQINSSLDAITLDSLTVKSAASTIETIQSTQHQNALAQAEYAAKIQAFLDPTASLRELSGCDIHDPDCRNMTPESYLRDIGVDPKDIQGLLANKQTIISNYQANIARDQKLVKAYSDPVTTPYEIAQTVCNGSPDCVKYFGTFKRDDYLKDITNTQLIAVAKTNYQLNLFNLTALKDTADFSKLPPSTRDAITKANTDVTKAFAAYSFDYNKKIPLDKNGNPTELVTVDSSNQRALDFGNMIKDDPSTLDKWLADYHKNEALYSGLITSTHLFEYLASEKNPVIIAQLKEITKNVTISGLSKNGSVLPWENISSSYKDQARQLACSQDKSLATLCDQYRADPSRTNPISPAQKQAQIALLDAKIEANSTTYLKQIFDLQTGANLQLSTSFSNVATINNPLVDQKLTAQALKVAEQKANPNVPAYMTEQYYNPDAKPLTQAEKASISNEYLDRQLVTETYKIGGGVAAGTAGFLAGMGLCGATIIGIVGAPVCGAIGAVAGVLASQVPLYEMTAEEFAQQRGGDDLSHSVFQSLYSSQGAWGDEGMGRSITTRNNQFALYNSINVATSGLTVEQIQNSPALQTNLAVQGQILNQWELNQNRQEAWTYASLPIAAVTGALNVGVGTSVASSFAGRTLTSASANSYIVNRLAGDTAMFVGSGVINQLQTLAQFETTGGDTSLLTSPEQVDYQVCVMSKGVDQCQGAELTAMIGSIAANRKFAMEQAFVTDTLTQVIQTTSGYAFHSVGDELNSTLARAEQLKIPTEGRTIGAIQTDVNLALKNATPPNGAPLDTDLIPISDPTNIRTTIASNELGAFLLSDTAILTETNGKPRLDFSSTHIPSDDEVNILNHLNRQLSAIEDVSGFEAIRSKQLEGVGLGEQKLAAQEVAKNANSDPLLVDLSIKPGINPNARTGEGKNTVILPLLEKIAIDSGTLTLHLAPEANMAGNRQTTENLRSFYDTDVYVAVNEKNSAGAVTARYFTDLDGNQISTSAVLARIRADGTAPMILADADTAMFALNDVISAQRNLTKGNSMTEVWSEIWNSKPTITADEIGTLSGNWQSNLGDPVAVSKLTHSQASLYLEGGEEILSIYRDTGELDIVQKARSGELVLTKNPANQSLKPLGDADMNQVIDIALSHAKTDKNAPSPLLTYLEEIQNMGDITAKRQAFDTLRKLTPIELDAIYGKNAGHSIAVANAYNDAIYSRLSIIASIAGNDYRDVSGPGGITIELANSKTISGQQYSEVMLKLALQDEGARGLNLNESSLVPLEDLSINTRSLAVGLDDMFSRAGKMIGYDATDRLASAKTGLEAIFDSTPLHKPKSVALAQTKAEVALATARLARAEFDNNKTALVIETNVDIYKLNDATTAHTTATLEIMNENENLYLALANGDGTYELYKVNGADKSSWDLITSTPKSAEELYIVSHQAIGADPNNKLLAIFENKTRGENFKPANSLAPDIRSAIVIGNPKTSISDTIQQSAGRVRTNPGVNPDYHFVAYTSDPDLHFQLTQTDPQNLPDIILAHLESNQSRTEGYISLERNIKAINDRQINNLIAELYKDAQNNAALRTQLASLESQIKNSGLAFATTPAEDQTAGVLHDQYLFTRGRIDNILTIAKKNGVGEGRINTLRTTFNLDSTALSLTSFEAMLTHNFDTNNLSGYNLALAKNITSFENVPETYLTGSPTQPTKSISSALQTTTTLTTRLTDSIAGLVRYPADAFATALRIAGSLTTPTTASPISAPSDPFMAIGYSLAGTITPHYSTPTLFLPTNYQTTATSDTDQGVSPILVNGTESPFDPLLRSRVPVELSTNPISDRATEIGTNLAESLFQLPVRPTTTTDRERTDLRQVGLTPDGPSLSATVTNILTQLSNSPADLTIPGTASQRPTLSDSIRQSIVALIHKAPSTPNDKLTLDPDTIAQLESNLVTIKEDETVTIGGRYQLKYVNSQYGNGGVYQLTDLQSKTDYLLKKINAGQIRGANIAETENFASLTPEAQNSGLINPIILVSPNNSFYIAPFITNIVEGDKLVSSLSQEEFTKLSGDLVVDLAKVNVSLKDVDLKSGKNIALIVENGKKKLILFDHGSYLRDNNNYRTIATNYINSEYKSLLEFGLEDMRPAEENISPMLSFAIIQNVTQILSMDTNINNVSFSIQNNSKPFNFMGGRANVNWDYVSLDPAVITREWLINNTLEILKKTSEYYQNDQVQYNPYSFIYYGKTELTREKIVAKYNERISQLEKAKAHLPPITPTTVNPPSRISQSLTNLVTATKSISSQLQSLFAPRQNNDATIRSVDLDNKSQDKTIVARKILSADNIPKAAKELIIFIDRVEQIGMQVVLYTLKIGNADREIIVVEDPDVNPLPIDEYEKILLAEPAIKKKIGGTFYQECDNAAACAIAQDLAQESLITLDRNNLTRRIHYIAQQNMADSSVYSLDYTFGTYVHYQQDVPLIIHSRNRDSLLSALNQTHQGRWQNYNDTTTKAALDLGIDIVKTPVPQFKSFREYDEWVRTQAIWTVGNYEIKNSTLYPSNNQNRPVSINNIPISAIASAKQLANDAYLLMMSDGSQGLYRLDGDKASLILRTDWLNANSVSEQTRWISATSWEQNISDDSLWKPTVIVDTQTGEVIPIHTIVGFDDSSIESIQTYEIPSDDDYFVFSQHDTEGYRLGVVDLNHIDRGIRYIPHQPNRTLITSIKNGVATTISGGNTTTLNLTDLFTPSPNSINHSLVSAAQNLGLRAGQAVKSLLSLPPIPLDGEPVTNPLEDRKPHINTYVQSVLQSDGDLTKIKSALNILATDIGINRDIIILYLRNIYDLGPAQAEDQLSSRIYNSIQSNDGYDDLTDVLTSYLTRYESLTEYDLFYDKNPIVQQFLIDKPSILPSKLYSRVVRQNGQVRGDDTLYYYLKWTDPIGDINRELIIDKDQREHEIRDFSADLSGNNTAPNSNMNAVLLYLGNSTYEIDLSRPITIQGKPQTFTDLKSFLGTAMTKPEVIKLGGDIKVTYYDLTGKQQKFSTNTREISQRLISPNATRWIAWLSRNIEGSKELATDYQPLLDDLILLRKNNLDIADNDPTSTLVNMFDPARLETMIAKTVLELQPKELENVTDLIGRIPLFINQNGISGNAKEIDVNSSLTIVQIPSRPKPITIHVAPTISPQTQITINGKSSTLGELASRDNREEIYLDFGDSISFGSISFSVGSNAVVKQDVKSIPITWVIDSSQTLSAAIPAVYASFSTIHPQITDLFNTIDQSPDINDKLIVDNATSIGTAANLSNLEVQNLIVDLRAYVNKAKKIVAILNKYPEPKALWRAAFGSYPQEVVTVERIGNTINFIVSSQEDIDQAWNYGSTETETEVNVYGFHHAPSTKIRNTENIFNIIDGNNFELIREATKVHELQHALYAFYSRFFPQSNRDWLQQAYPSELIAKIYELLKDKDTSPELQEHIKQYALLDRRLAENQVADELLAQISGYQKTGTNWEFTKNRSKTSMKYRSYSFILQALDNSQDKIKQTSIYQQYFSEEAQENLVEQGLEAYEILRTKGYSHDEIMFKLQSARLADWKDFSQSAPDLIKVQATINLSGNKPLYLTPRGVFSTQRAAGEDKIIISHSSRQGKPIAITLSIDSFFLKYSNIGINGNTRAISEMVSGPDKGKIYFDYGDKINLGSTEIEIGTSKAAGKDTLKTPLTWKLRPYPEQNFEVPLPGCTSCEIRIPSTLEQALAAKTEAEINAVIYRHNDHTFTNQQPQPAVDIILRAIKAGITHESVDYQDSLTYLAAARSLLSNYHPTSGASTLATPAGIESLAEQLIAVYNTLLVEGTLAAGDIPAHLDALNNAESYLKTQMTSSDTHQSSFITRLSRQIFNARLWLNRKFGDLALVRYFSTQPPISDNTPIYTENKAITQNGLTLTRHDIEFVSQGDDSYWQRFRRFGYSSWGPRGPLTDSEIRAKIKAGAKVILLATGLDSNADEFQNAGSSLVHSLFANSADPENLVVIAINAPGLALSQLTNTETTYDNITIESYRNLTTRFAKAMGLNKDNTVLIGHSKAGEMAIGMGEIFDKVISLTPSLHLNTDPVFTFISFANNVGTFASNLGLHPLVTYIRNMITTAFLRTTPVQLAVHARVQSETLNASILSGRELAIPDIIPQHVPKNLKALLAYRDILTPPSASAPFLAAMGETLGLDPTDYVTTLTDWYDPALVLDAGHVSMFTDPLIVDALSSQANLMLSQNTLTPLPLPQTNPNPVRGYFAGTAAAHSPLRSIRIIPNYLLQLSGRVTLTTQIASKILDIPSVEEFTSKNCRSLQLIPLAYAADNSAAQGCSHNNFSLQKSLQTLTSPQFIRTVQDVYKISGAGSGDDDKNKKKYTVGRALLAYAVLESLSKITPCVEDDFSFVLTKRINEILVDESLNLISDGVTSGAQSYALTNNKNIGEIIDPNPNYRPYSEIIQEGIDNYLTNNPNSEIKYSRSPRALSYTDILDYLEKPYSQSRYINPIFLTDKYANKNKPQAFIGYLLTNNQTPNFNPVTALTGTFEGLIYSNDTTGFALDVARTSDLFPTKNSISITDISERNSLKKIIEQEVERTHQPISHSFIIEYYLKLDHGDLSQALSDAANFEKIIARPPEVIQKSNTDTYTWIRDNIKDEYSNILPYEKLPNTEETLPNGDIYYDYSLQNRIGGNYHAANIVALLQYFPPEIIDALVIGEYLSFGKSHGLAKASSDLHVLQDLNKINRLLNSYNPHPDTYRDCGDYAITP